MKNIHNKMATGLIQSEIHAKIESPDNNEHGITLTDFQVQKI